MQLTRQYGLGKGGVLKLLQEAGVTLRGQGLSPAQVDRAVQLYAEGLSLVKLSAQLPTSPGTIWLALKERGISMRPANQAGRRRAR